MKLSRVKLTHLIINEIFQFKRLKRYPNNPILKGNPVNDYQYADFHDPQIHSVSQKDYMRQVAGLQGNKNDDYHIHFQFDSQGEYS